MPLARDKILINGGGGGGNSPVRGDIEGNHVVVCAYNAALIYAFSTAEMVAKEIEEHGWEKEPEAIAFRDAQTKLCLEIENAQASYTQLQAAHVQAERALVTKMSAWLDSKILAKP